MHSYTGPIENKPVLHANNKGTDQPVHPLSLISILVIRSMELIIASSSYFGIYPICKAISLNMYAQLLSGPSDQIFSLSPKLHPYFVQKDLF